MTYGYDTPHLKGTVSALVLSGGNIEYKKIRKVFLMGRTIANQISAGEMTLKQLYSTPVPIFDWYDIDRTAKWNKSFSETWLKRKSH